MKVRCRVSPNGVWMAVAAGEPTSVTTAIEDRQRYIFSSAAGKRLTSRNCIRVHRLLICVTINVTIRTSAIDLYKLIGQLLVGVRSINQTYDTCIQGNLEIDLGIEPTTFTTPVWLLYHWATNPLGARWWGVSYLYTSALVSISLRLS